MLGFIGNLLLGFCLATPLRPVNYEIIKRGLRYGFLPAYLISLGAVFADFTYLLIVYIVLSNFLSFEIIKALIFLLAASILIHRGYQRISEWRRKPDPERFKIDYKLKKRVLYKSFISGYLISISNPRNIIIWFGVFGSLLSFKASSNPIIALSGSLTVLLGVAVWFTVLSLLLAKRNKYVNSKNLRLAVIISGLALIFFGLLFAYNALIDLNLTSVQH